MRATSVHVASWREIVNHRCTFGMDMDHECEGAKPSWAAEYDLKLCGQYYEGFVDDYEALLTRHRLETVTSYGVRRSRQNAGGDSTSHNNLENKENTDIQDIKPQSDKV